MPANTRPLTHSQSCILEMPDDIQAVQLLAARLIGVGNDMAICIDPSDTNTHFALIKPSRDKLQSAIAAFGRDGISILAASGVRYMVGTELITV